MTGRARQWRCYTSEQLLNAVAMHRPLPQSLWLCHSKSIEGLMESIQMSRSLHALMSTEKCVLLWSIYLPLCASQ